MQEKRYIYIYIHTHKALRYIKHSTPADKQIRTNRTKKKKKKTVKKEEDLYIDAREKIYIYIYIYIYIRRMITRCSVLAPPKMSLKKQGLLS
jgi:hypothetical protein